MKPSHKPDDYRPDDPATPGVIDISKLEYTLGYLGKIYTADNAIKLLCERAGFTEEQIDEQFPNLRGFSGNVKVDVSSADQPPVIISISEVPTVAEGEAGSHMQLWYAYNVTNGQAHDMIDYTHGHPRNLSDEEREMDPRELRRKHEAMEPGELAVHQARNRERRALKES